MFVYIFLDFFRAMLKTEIESAINGKQWLLSCFGPFKESTVIPNLMDRSFEEVRLDFFEASKNGAAQQHVNELIAQYNDSMSKLNQLKIASPETVQLVANIYNQSVQEQKPQAAPSTSNVFALSNAAVNSTQPQVNPFQLGSVFGGTQSTSSVMNTGSVFGGASTNPSAMNAGSIFGGQPAASNIFQSPTQTSIFGGVKEQQPAPVTSNFSFSLGQQAAKPSVYGSALPTSPQSSIFGASQATPQQPMGSSIFGGQATNTFGASSIFGSTPIQPQQPQPTSSPFSSSIFAQSQPAGSGIFGSPQQPPQQSQMFGQPATHPAPSFIQPAAQQIQPFGQPATGSVFGGFQPQPDSMQQNSVFGQASVVPSNNVFGVQQPAPQAVPVPQMQPAASGSIFQIQQPNVSQKTPFGTNPFLTQAEPVDERAYSKIEDLTTEEIQAFQAPTFELGKIPLKPPPKQLCN